MEKVVFIANVDCGTGMSGGSTIYFELLKRFYDSFQLFFLGSHGTIKKLKQEKIKNITYIESDNNDSSNLYSIFGIFYHSVRRLLKGIQSIYKNSDIFDKVDYIYSASDFWPDIIPALLIKWRNPKVKWVTAFYFFAPKPWQRINPYASSLIRRIIGIFYWLTQLLAYILIRKWANLVIACNEIDRKIFIRDGFPEENIIAIYGGVDLDFINSVPTPKKQIYDAVFMARFHSQKGPIFAVKSWSEVIKTFPHAKLAMIGNGSEEAKIIHYIKKMNLTKNVSLLGFMDKHKKYKVLKSSKIFIHPAIYETGGMAAAEGMACGLPVVAFNQEGYKYCYPQGLLGVSPIGDHHKFAQAILELMIDNKKYVTMRKEAKELVTREWDWNKRASFILRKMQHA